MNYPTALPLSDVRFNRGWLADRTRLVREVVIPYQWEALNDRVPGAEPSGCVHNFQVTAGEKPGKFHGLFWQDSDLAKWLEAASYRLTTHPDPKLEAEIDRLIATLAKAQGPDGYLNTYFQLVEPQNRWANLRDCHELYVAGHMIEAGVAHFRATGKRTLLTVVCKLADLIDRTFGLGPGQIPGYCGHEEVELALVKLARATGEARYARLAAYFVNQRGQEPNYLAEETRRRGDQLPWHMYHDGLATLQAARPVRELTEPVGHAVRQLYLLAAMADLAAEVQDDSLLRSCRTLWDNIVRRHLYLTGGVGSEPYGEKFSEPFDLPPDRAYAETCAAIGVIFFARRMLDHGLRGEYADVMERALYNNVQSGMSVDGTKFFYVNPLELVPAVAKRRYECHLVKTQRVGWFGCACCPPNVARLFASLGEYLASQRTDGLALHLYADCDLRFTAAGRDVRLTVQTDYPWTEAVAIEVNPTTAGATADAFTLHLRIPGWCRGATLTVNGTPHPLAPQDGYVALSRSWQAGDRLVLTLPMPVERIHADPRVTTVAGCTALQRGPVVYCFEEADHGANLAALTLPRTAPLVARPDPALLGGCVVIEGAGTRDRASGQLYTPTAPVTETVPLRAIPYGLWANRGEGEMRVWIRES